MARPIERALEADRSGELLSQVRKRPGARSFNAGSKTWSVYEELHSRLGRSLIFESERIARRVRNYPGNWRDLTDEQLAELSLSR